MIARAAAFALLLLAGATPALADQASEVLFRGFVLWVDASPDWSASTSIIRSDGDDTIAETLVFTRAEPQVSITIKELRLTDFGAGDNGGFTASAMEMTAGSVVTEMVDASIPSASASDVSMPSFEGVSFDTRHLMTSIARFYALSAEGELAELSIPEITVAQRQPVAGQSKAAESLIVYRDLLVSNLADGVLEHQEMGPITVSVDQADGDPVEFGFAKVEADRVDLGSLAHVLDPSEYSDNRGDGIWRPIVSRASYQGLSAIGADGSTFAIDEIAIENIDGRQPEKPFAEVWDRLIDPDYPQDAKDDLALEAMSAMTAAWRLGNLRLEGIAIDVPEKSTFFSLDTMTLTGWSNAGFDSFLLKALAGGSPDGILSLDSLEIAGFIAPDMKALVDFAAIDKDLPIEAHADAIGKTFAALPRIAHFGLHGVTAGKSEADSGSLESFTLDFRDWNEVFAGATDITIDKLAIPRRLLELDPNTTEMLDTLGYDDLVFSLSLADRWDPDAGTDDAVWTATLENAARVELSYRIIGLTRDWLVRATAAAAKGEDNDAALMAMAGDLRLAEATLSVTDHSLLDRGFAVAAAKQGLNVGGAAYREQMRAALPFLISAAVPEEVAKLFTAPLQAFLAGEQTLFATIAPPTPLGILDLMAAAGDPMGLPARLNLTLRSEAAAE